MCYGCGYTRFQYVLWLKYATDGKCHLLLVVRGCQSRCHILLNCVQQMQYEVGSYNIQTLAATFFNAFIGNNNANLFACDDNTGQKHTHTKGAKIVVTVTTKIENRRFFHPQIKLADLTHLKILVWAVYFVIGVHMKKFRGERGYAEN